MEFSKTKYLWNLVKQIERFLLLVFSESPCLQTAAPVVLRGGDEPKNRKRDVEERVYSGEAGD